MTTPKKEPWRIIVGIAAIIYIVFLWVKKDIAAIYASMPPEQVAPMILTTLAVSLVKVIVLTGGILLLKWLLTKFQEKQKHD
jgi:hypothetical protein